jgi:hypothetical protein
MVRVAPMASGASSQCADTIRIAVGRGMSFAHAASWPGQIGSSASGGAPWLTYSAGMRMVLMEISCGSGRKGDAHSSPIT